MAALLIERGAELTPLSAAALGDWDYLASCPLDSLQGKGLLQAAVRSNRPAVLRQLLEMGLDPNERMQIGQLEDQTFSAGGPLLEAVNTGRIDMARLLIAHGADPNASVFTSGSATAAAYTGGSPRGHAPDQAMIDLMVEHGGWIDAASVGYLRNVDLARRMLQGEVDRIWSQARSRVRPSRNRSCGAARAAGVPRSCAWRSSGSTGRATTRAGSGCSGVRCPGTRI